MIKHYFKLAVRNLLKYKTQSIVSIIGLAVGFACFALSTMWIHYDMTYDTQHKDADRLYLLCQKSVLTESGYSKHVVSFFAQAIKDHFPEVEEACAYLNHVVEALPTEEGVSVGEMDVLTTDTCFAKLFDIALVEGSWEFLQSENQLAVTESFARRLFGTTEEVVGRNLIDHSGRKMQIGALLRAEAFEHSNLKFDAWLFNKYFVRGLEKRMIAVSICVKLHKGVDYKAFQQKLQNSDIRLSEKDKEPLFEDIHLIPLCEYYYSDMNNIRGIGFHYLILFSVVGMLVILCSLFNYLALFVTRMDIRKREVELRRVCGSSRLSLLALFMIEYGLLILCAGFVGMVIIELILPEFCRLSGVQGNMYAEFFLYFVGLLLFSLFLLLPFVLRSSWLRSRQNKQLGVYRISILLQLFISILFIFGVSVLIKQIYFQQQTDLGWQRSNRAVLVNIHNHNEKAARLEQLACVDTIMKNHICLFPSFYLTAARFTDWEDKPDEADYLVCTMYSNGRSIVDFYNLHLLEGELMNSKEEDKVLLNETAVKLMGITHPVGKWMKTSEGVVTIVGVVKDFHIDAPTVPVRPTMITEQNNWKNGDCIHIKFHEGKWDELKAQVDSMFNTYYPDEIRRYRLENLDKTDERYLGAEKLLMVLLLITSSVCMAVSLFGIFSLVTLSCERRRKEIAIRKVNGARIGDILGMFAREYLLMLVVASVIAFPVGYAVMKRWLESYVHQTPIPIWIYVAIFAAVALLIALCIGWRVWLAAKQNPAEVIKSE